MFEERKKYLLKMAQINKATWGPKPKLLRSVFRCVVRPMIVYGSVVWAHVASKYRIITKLRIINCLALGTLTMFPRSLLVRALEIFADIFPLHLWLEKEELNELLPRTFRGLNRVGHRKFWELKVVEYGFEHLLLEIDVCFARFLNTRFEVDVESFGKNNDYFEALTNKEWKVFTDGSKREARVGLAFIILRHGELWAEEFFRLPDEASVFQAEVFAIYRATQQLNKVEDPGTGMGRIFSDSLSALQALKSGVIESALVFQTVESLHESRMRFSLH